MERCAPGVQAGEPLEARGRARRFRLSGGGELWRLDADGEALARRLEKLSLAGVGGFVSAGIDDDGVWLVRMLPRDRLKQLRRDDPGPWSHRLATSIALSLGRALDACEAQSLFPGALSPSSVALALASDDAEMAHVCLPAESLIGAMVGEAATARATDSGGKALMYGPPEQIDGAVWNAACNRYALGVILYELIAGSHPFGGAGLRHALREAGQAEAAPFPSAVRRELPAGLQSLCLRMIAPDPALRPASARDIVDELEALLERRSAPTTRRSEVAMVDEADEAPRAPEEESEDAREERRRRAVAAAGAAIDVRWMLSKLSHGRLRFVPLLLGVLACGAALAFALDTPASKPVEKPDIAPQRPVSAATLKAGDCASCHPRHAAEWSQSVMGHSVKSPLFNALESLIEEQVGRDVDCPNGAGILRKAPPGRECRDRQSGLSVTGSGGEHWCVNCHAPGDNLGSRMPAWEGLRGGDPATHKPVRDLISEVALEGISCAFCHQVHGPVEPTRSAYQGNPSWRSFVTGITFLSRPEDRRGLNGIANSGYLLDAAELLLRGVEDPTGAVVTSGGHPVHARPSDSARAYLTSSQFCGSCHDVRLFGTDVLGAQKGEHFKRLRNAYSEWAAWADDERRLGREPATCQGCHMSTYPGVCVEGKADSDEPIHRTCPDGMHFEPHAPGQKARGRVATTSGQATPLSPHYFTGVDLPLANDISDEVMSQPGVDQHGIPLSTRARRDQLLMRSMRFELGEARRAGASLEVPVIVENDGSGHKVPAGFSQEREIWVHLKVEDQSGATLYEVGRVDRNDEDLRDKVFLRVNTDPDQLDGLGRPLGMFGADVRDGPDHPEWSPPPELGGTRFRGKGLINFQNGFLRCVRCIGIVDQNGECQSAGLDRHRAERFADGDYDIDTGECRSNLFGRAALFEIYFPVGALDSERGLVKGPDAIIDTRSLSPNQPVTYTYALDTRGRPGPFTVTARLMFRSFPPFLVKAFADYEARQAARGRRPSGPLVTLDMMRRLERVELHKQTLVVP